ncbi:hypothetical protein KRP22_011408 [Phytophthora ramorum]|uniref:Elicitin n=1 Tax=Phytophthora ramorum TaxID=164328 RepID=Q2N0B7_PHYRM|nr:elicitin-like protein RAL2E [Phytophthora ramorum]KAH7489189.1 hypothetical protein KRP23_3125 [Phytophthora ramorum]KAH7499996.1 hypothetical protein KRP22_10610 [Phytophthora ramorum]
MKSFAATLTALVVLTSQASAATCSSAVLSALLTDQYIDQCSSDSGYVFTAASIPDQATIDKMCASSACKGLLADTQALGLEECTLPVGDNINLLGDLVDYVPAHCPATDAPATDSPSTDAPTTATPATEAPTATSSSNTTDAAATPAPTKTTTTSTATAC